MIYKVNISVQILMNASDGKPDVEILTRDILEAIRGKNMTDDPWNTRSNVRIIDYSIDSEKVI